MQYALHMRWLKAHFSKQSQVYFDSFPIFVTEENLEIIIIFIIWVVRHEIILKLSLTKLRLKALKLAFWNTRHF